MRITSVARRRWLVLLGVAVLFTVVGFFVLPPVVKAQLEKRLSRELGRKVTVEKVRLNPYALSLTLENLAIREADGAAVFLGWDRLYVNFDALSSLRGEWVLSEVALAGFAVRVRVNRDQSLNFSDLITKLTPPVAPAAAPSKPARPVRIARLQVAGARVDMADASRARPFATVLGPLTFDLTEFRTVSERGAPYRFEAATEAGEKLAWSGTLRAEPFHSAGELSLENIALPKYAPYYSELVQAELIAGKLSVRGRYEIDQTKARPVLRIHDTTVQVRGLTLRERATEQTAMELAALDLTGLQVDALTQKVSAGALVLSGGQVRVRREKDGAINLLTMLQPSSAAPMPPSNPPAPSPASPVSAPPAVTKPPEVNFTEVTLKDFSIDVIDHAAPRPAQIALSALQLSLKNVTLADGATMPLELAFGWAPRGTVRLAGSVGLSPIVADLKVEVAGLELLPLSPYLEQFANARLTQGALTVTLDTQVSLPVGQPPVATVAGDIKVEKFGLVDGAQSEDLAGFAELILQGLRADTDPAKGISLEAINVVGPYVRVVVNADKSINLATVAKSDAAPTPPVAGATPAASADASVPPAPVPTAPAAIPGAAASPKIAIGKVTISEGDFRFSDRSITPAVSMAINHFGGVISGLASTNLARADVDLKAMVDGAGPVAITGKLDPLGAKPSVDLKIDFKNVDLLPLSPYSGKYAGFEIARGKLVLDVKLLVDGKKIDSANVITLNQFTFGSPVKSADATSLPVRLGVALLKDTDGKIVMDVPVQGNTDDPNFQISRVVLRVVVNLLTKAAVSPFALLGSAFGGGGDELAFQEFAPGSPELQATELKKLQTMATALTNRPALSLDLEGSYDTAADAYALKRVKLEERVRRTIWETKRAADPNIAPPEQLVLTAEDRVAAIKQLYEAAFPAGTQFGAPLLLAPAIVAPPPPPPRPGFFRRMMNMVTFKAKPAGPTPAEAESARLAAEHAKAVQAAATTSLPFEEMSGRLAEATTVDDNDLRALAQARAERVREYFAGVGKIAADRLFLAKDRAEGEKQGKGPRVFLHLQ